MILIGRGLDLRKRKEREEKKRLVQVNLNLCSFEGAEERQKISGDNGWRVPPVPIPNTEVKPPRADGTWLETARESRTLPGNKRERERWKSLPASVNESGRSGEGNRERRSRRAERRERKPTSERGNPRERPGKRGKESRRNFASVSEEFRKSPGRVPAIRENS